MKVLGMDIPTTPAELWEYISPGHAQLQSQINALRMRKRPALKPKGKKRYKSIWQPIAEYIWSRDDLRPGGESKDAFIAAEISRLKQKTFDPRWWKQLNEQSSSWYSSTGSGPTDANPPPYNYRDPDYKPQSTVYTSGTPAAAPSSTSGQTTAQQWSDQIWVWKKTEYLLLEAPPGHEITPIVQEMDGSITASANKRGSRPMLSLIFRAHLVADSSPYDGDLSAPVYPSTTYYWWWRITQNNPDNYAATKPRHVSSPVHDRATRDEGQELSRAIIKSGARPMLGHGYNNNTDVLTTWSGQEKVWQVKPREPKAEPTTNGFWFSVDDWTDYGFTAQSDGPHPTMRTAKAFWKARNIPSYEVTYALREAWNNLYPNDKIPRFPSSVPCPKEPFDGNLNTYYPIVPSTPRAFWKSHGQIEMGTATYPVGFIWSVMTDYEQISKATNCNMFHPQGNQGFFFYAGKFGFRIQPSNVPFNFGEYSHHVRFDTNQFRIYTRNLGGSYVVFKFGPDGIARLYDYYNNPTTFQTPP